MSGGNRTSRLRILVLRDPGFQLDGQDTGSGEITAMLEQEPSFKVSESAAGYGEAARAAHRGDIDLVIVDEVAGEPAAVVEQLDQAVPEIPVIVLLDSDHAMLAQACILAGARAYLFRPFEPNDLIDMIRRIYEKEDRRRRKTAPQGGPKSGRLIAVHGPKGGVGTTTVAVNLAVAIYQQTNLRVVLVDGSLLSGDVAVAMNIANENSIADVVAHLRELDGDLLNDTLLHHGAGVWVLPAPSELERAEVINGEETTAVLAALRQHFDVVVVDTASRPDEHLLAALDQSDVVLVVCTPEIASLKNAARFLALAHELGYGDEKLKLTINRLSSHGSIPLKDIEANLRHKMAFGLPSDGIPVIEALNAGEPVVLMRPSARIAREIRTVAGELVALVGDGRLEVRVTQRGLAGAWRDDHEVAGGVQPVMPQLRLHGVPVRGERGRLDEDPGATAQGPEERRQQQVQVDRERVHGHDLVRSGAHEACGPLADDAVSLDPCGAAAEVALHALGGPRIELREDRVPCRTRLDAQGVAREVRRLRAVRGARDVEQLAQAGHGIAGVGRPCAGFRGRDREGGGHAPTAAARPRNRSAVSRVMVSRAAAPTSDSAAMAAPGCRSPSGKG